MFLERLVDRLNSQECFAHFQKYPWPRGGDAPMAEGGGPEVEGGGPGRVVVVRWRRAAKGGGSVVVESNQQWVVVGDNRGNLIFSYGKIFPSHENVTILCVFVGILT